MTQDSLCALVLAAGKGTRMHSNSPKVLRRLLDEPMLTYVYSALTPLFGEEIYTVVGFQAHELEEAFPERKDKFVLQEPQLGTGHALKIAWEAMESEHCLEMVVINGDTPLVQTETIERFVEQSREAGADLSFMTITVDEENSFGKVVRDDTGNVEAIVEAKDFKGTTKAPPREVNAGIYYLKTEAVAPLLGWLSNKNASSEYYITDLVVLAIADERKVVAFEFGSDNTLMGINSPAELIESEELLRKRIVQDWIAQGVIIHAPDSVRIGPRVTLTPGIEITGPCEMYGDVVVSEQVRIDSHCVIIESWLSAGSHVRNFSHLEHARVGERCVVGPYARLRPSAILENESKVGNFVEMKKAVLGEGAKANHLTYIGDAEVGAGTNIGAGTITCNYDGKNKFKTTIGKKAFIGSNTALVAPVEIGDGALVAAGSTITKNVPAEKLGLGRAKQVNREWRKVRS